MKNLDKATNKFVNENSINISNLINRNELLRTESDS